MLLALSCTLLILQFYHTGARARATSIYPCEECDWGLDQCYYDQNANYSACMNAASAQHDNCLSSDESEYNSCKQNCADFPQGDYNGCVQGCDNTKSDNDIDCELVYENSTQQCENDRVAYGDYCADWYDDCWDNCDWN